MGKITRKDDTPLPTAALAELTRSDSVLMGMWHIQVRLRTRAFLWADGSL